jgi:hypothetical protein
MDKEDTKVPPSGNSSKDLVGCLSIVALVGGVIWWSVNLHDRPYYRTDVVLAEPANDSGGDNSKILVAISEEALSELANAGGRQDWTAALATGRAVFQVPGGIKLAIIDRNVLGWSFDHPRHAGVALKVRVLDGEHAGQIGYVLAASLKFLLIIA